MRIREKGGFKHTLHKKQKTADSVTFTEEILNGKFIFCVH